MPVEEASATAGASAGAAAVRRAARDISWPTISTAAAYIVDPPPPQPPDKAAHIADLFDEFDADHSGALSRDELKVSKSAVRRTEAAAVMHCCWCTAVDDVMCMLAVGAAAFRLAKHARVCEPDPQPI